MAAEARQSETSQQGFLIAVALAALAFLVVLVLPVFHSGRARTTLERQAVDLVTLSASQAAPALLSGDRFRIERLMDGLASIPEVTYVAVRRGPGKPLASRNPERAQDIVSKGGVGALYTAGTLHVSAPVLGIEPLTTLQIGYSTASVDAQRTIDIAMASILCLALLAGAAAVAFGARRPVLVVESQEKTDLHALGAGARTSATASIISSDEFLAFISHELRTPLNAIIGYAEILQEDAVHLEQTDFLPDLKKIEKAGTHLITLVDDLVGLSKVYSGSMELDIESFTVGHLLEEVQEDVRSLLNRTLATLDVHATPQVHRMKADREKVKRMLGNVIRQVAALSGQGSMHLDIRRENTPEKAWLLFTLTNPDLVLTEEQIDGLIHEFDQTKAKDLPQFSGSGLGLIVSREFCRLQGGIFELTSNEDDGTTLLMKMPERVPEFGSASDQSA